MPAIVERARAQWSAQWSAKGSVVVLLACAATIVALTTFQHRYGLAHLALDRGAIRAWLDGDGLYDYRSPDSHVGTAVPPAAAYALIGTALLPLPLAGWLLGLGGIAALALSLVALAGPVARRYGRRRWPAVCVASALALTLQPVRAAIGFGDLDLLLFGLITADVVALRRGAWARSRATWWPGRPASAPARGRPVVHLLRRGWSTGAWAGAGIGIATALAVGPGLFILYLAVTRQWRVAFTALGTAATLTIGALFAAPDQTATWFSDVLWRVDRTGGIDRISNQSLAGVLARLYQSPTTPVLLWLSFAVLLLAVGLIRARSAHADGDEIAAFTLVGLTGAAIGPVTDAHELVWVLPALLILIDAAARQRLVGRRPLTARADRYLGAGWGAAAVLTYLLFLIAPLWTFGGGRGVGPALVGNAYAIALILLVNALPWRPGVAPAFPINRWIKQNRNRSIPPARRPTGS